VTSAFARDPSGWDDDSGARAPTSQAWVPTQTPGWAGTPRSRAPPRPSRIVAG